MSSLALGNASRSNRKLLLAVWALIIILSPVYLFSSGKPQPANFLAILLVGLIMLGSGFRYPTTSRSALRWLIVFVWYVTVVNVTWSLLLANDLELVGSSHRLIGPHYIALFYIFNLLVFLTFLTLYANFGEKALKVTVYAVAMSLVFQLLVVIIFRSGQFRETGLFNNPNQLAHNALLCGSLFLVGASYFKIHRAYQLVALMAVLYLISVSLSKAGMAATAALLIIALPRRPLVAVAGLAAFVILVLTVDSTIFDRMDQRLTSQPDKISGLASRGYDRIANHPEYLVLGAAEGLPERFDTLLERHEMHSSFGTILFSYGIVGLSIFLAFLWSIYRSSYIGQSIYMVPVLLYGLSHQGLRAPLLWILLAFILCLGEERRLKGKSELLARPRTYKVGGRNSKTLRLGS